jgi:hydrogenase maturation protease
MDVSTGPDTCVRLLGLGNEILADDAFGIRVAREVEQRFGQAVEVVASSESGFNLLDQLLGASRLLVVDTVTSAGGKPGTIHIFEEDSVRPVPGQSPHFIGLFEVLAVARKLGLDVPRRTTIIAVEAADCSTVGDSMHPDVRAAINRVADWVGHSLEEEQLR